MKRCVIFAASFVKNYDKVKTNLRQDDYIICADGGLKIVEELSLYPNLIVGDFDSYEKEKVREKYAGIEVIELPCQKDDTDTFFAAKEGLKRGFDSFLLFGVIGGRFDHSLANISVLRMLYENGAKAEIIDDYSRMQIVAKKCVSVSDDCSFFSLIALDDKISGVNIKNAKYPLENAVIKSSFQYGVSNEVIKGEKALISIDNGVGLLIVVE